MRTLVTGGAGFIGNYLAERFVADGHDVVVLDSFDSFYNVRIKDDTVELCCGRSSEGDGSYRLVEDDVRDTDLVTDLVEESDYMYHQAAQAGVRPTGENPRKTESTSVAR